MEIFFTVLDWWLYARARPASVQMAIVTLVLAVISGWVGEAYRWSRRAGPKKELGKRKGLGVLLVVLLATLLPGGLVGSAAIAAVMGKANWRRDAVGIAGLSLIPAFIMFWMCSTSFPWPIFGENLYVRGTAGIAFAVLQIWITIKLLREGLGEPRERVPWWPPLALWLQTVLLVEAVLLVLSERS